MPLTVFNNSEIPEFEEYSPEIKNDGIKDKINIMIIVITVKSG